jgi:hypothetical protein
MVEQIPPSPQQPPKKGYGKRPIWHWVVLYVVAAVVIYGLIYYFFLRDSAGGNGFSY